jgi:hypothetical protein
MEEVLRDRHEPGESLQLPLDTHHRCALEVRRRLDEPDISRQAPVSREVVEENFQRLVAREEELPRLLIAAKELAYAREM